MTPLINVKAFKCAKCGWIWLSRQYMEDQKSLPIACAKCKSPYWNREPSTTTNTTKTTNKEKDKK
jgi:DNA-directed RNA polymerase subunit RPC12/RpoP